VPDRFQVDTDLMMAPGLGDYSYGSVAPEALDRLPGGPALLAGLTGHGRPRSPATRSMQWNLDASFSLEVALDHSEILFLNLSPLEGKVQGAMCGGVSREENHTAAPPIDPVHHECPVPPGGKMLIDLVPQGPFRRIPAGNDQHAGRLRNGNHIFVLV